MYKVYCENYTKNSNGQGGTYTTTLIHDSASPIKEAHLINPTLELKDLASGTFDFTIPPYNVAYDLVQRFTSTICVEKEGQLIWTGRVLSESRDFWKNRACKAEGALSFLVDITTPISKIWRMQYSNGVVSATTTQVNDVRDCMVSLLTIYNSKVEDNRYVFMGSCNIHDSPENETKYETNNGTILDELKENILDVFDGHLKIIYGVPIDPGSQGASTISPGRKYPIIEYFDDTGLDVASQSIDFGVNLLDFTRDYNASQIATVLYPRGKQSDIEDNYGMKQYLTIASLPNQAGSPYIFSNAVDTYGRVEKVVDFSDCENPAELYNLGVAYLTSQQFDGMTLTIKALDMHRLHQDIDSFELLERVRCVSKPHGLDKEFVLSEISLQLDAPDSATYTLGSNMTYSLSSTVSGNRTSVIKSLRSLGLYGRVLDYAKSEATELLTSKTRGYVNIVNDDQWSQALIISNTPDWETSNQYWIFNMNGLGFVNRRSPVAANVPHTAATDQYGVAELAITMDGTIVADRIKTGRITDSVGNNFWDLETGEFSLMSISSTTTIGANGPSVGNLVTSVDTANAKKSGAANYLNGTANWADWRLSGRWQIGQTNNGQEELKDVAVCRAGTTVSWNDVIRSPVESIPYSAVKGYRMTFSMELMSSDTWGTMSASNSIVVSFSLMTGRGTRIGKIDKAFVAKVAWTRTYVSVVISDEVFNKAENKVNETDSHYTGHGVTTDRFIEIRIYNRSKHEIGIRRLQFERGNTPTDWAISRYDQDKEAQNKANKAETNAGNTAKGLVNTAVINTNQKIEDAYSDLQKYTAAVSSDDRKFTKEQLQQLDISYNQEKIMKRLSNNLTSQGIWLYNKHLYINASYVTSGTLDANIIKAGIIMDKVSKNKWNLETGYFETKNGVFTNARVDGRFDTGPQSGQHLQLANGQFVGYDGNRLIGFIDASGSTINLSNGRLERGLQIYGKEMIRITTPHLAVKSTSRISETHIFGRSADIHIEFVKNAWLNGDGSLTVSYGAFDIETINGVVVYTGSA